MRKTLLISLVFFAILAVAVLSWPTAGYDLNRVHPSLRQLATPYQTVGTSYFLDGGSIGVAIVDRDGRRLLLALPVIETHAAQPNAEPGSFRPANDTARFRHLDALSPLGLRCSLRCQTSGDQRRHAIGIVDTTTPCPASGLLQDRPESGVSREFLVRRKARMR